MQRVKSSGTRTVMICFAALINALNLKTFVNAAGLYPGGFTGLTLLMQELFHRFNGIDLPFAPINLLFNSIPAIISFKFIGKKYTLFSCLMIVLTSVLADFIPVIPVVDDVTLCAVFGGIIGSVASTLCLLAGATAGGTDFIAIFISEKFSMDAWGYIFGLNLCILGTAGALFGWEAALYSIIYQYVAMQVLQMLYRRYQKVTLFVITLQPELAYQIIKDETNHDATRVDAVGCYTNQPKTILYSVISADEARRVVGQLKKVDNTAFINVVKSDHIRGNFYSPPKD